jgi:hypothetical protein
MSYYERDVSSPRRADDVFSRLDDIDRLARHMSHRSAAMFGSRLELIVDKTTSGVGQLYQWRGRVLGMRIAIDERVTVYRPPYEKRWCTVGSPQLIIIAGYCMGFVVRETTDGTSIRLRLEYELPLRGIGRLAGRLFGEQYARWCVDRMAADA